MNGISEARPTRKRTTPLVIGLEPNDDLDAIIAEFCRARDVVRRYELIRNSSSRTSIHQKAPADMVALSISIRQTEREARVILDLFGERLRAYLASYISAGIPSDTTSDIEIDRWFTAHCVFNTALTL